jgi:Domain of unknown function (DUF4360)
VSHTREASVEITACVFNPIAWKSPRVFSHGLRATTSPSRLYPSAHDVIPALSPDNAFSLEHLPSDHGGCMNAATRTSSAWHFWTNHFETSWGGIATMNIRVLSSLAAAALASFFFTQTTSAHVLAGGPFNEVIPDQVNIVSMTHGGSGCPINSVGASFSTDYQYLTIIFDEYAAQIGQYVDSPKKRLFCHLVLQLDFPAGLSFALVDLTYRGYADLDAGINAAQTSTYYFQGFRKDDQYSFKTRIFGPFLGDYDRTDSLELLAWSPCNEKRGLNIVTSVQLDDKRNKSGSGLITLDSIDSQVVEQYGIRWRNCTP